MRTAIIVSIGAKQIEKQGWRNIKMGFNYCTNSENDTLWTYRLFNPPKHTNNLTTVFIVAGGRVRYKATYFGIMPNPIKESQTKDHWLQMFDFEPVRIRINLKGFQGFRYVKPDSELAKYYDL